MASRTQTPPMSAMAKYWLSGLMWTGMASCMRYNARSMRTISEREYAMRWSEGRRLLAVVSLGGRLAKKVRLTCWNMDGAALLSEPVKQREWTLKYEAKRYRPMKNRTALNGIRMGERAINKPKSSTRSFATSDSSYLTKIYVAEAPRMNAAGRVTSPRLWIISWTSSVAYCHG